MPHYAIGVWESSDCIWEGVATNGIIKLYRYCCDLENCPTDLVLDKWINKTDEEVKDWLGGKDNKFWAMVNDPAIVGLRLDDQGHWPKEYQD